MKEPVFCLNAIFIRCMFLFPCAHSRISAFEMFFLCTPSPPSATTGIQSSFLFFFQGFVYYYGGIEWSRQRGGHALVHPCIAAGLCKGHGSFDADADASKAVMRVHARTHPAFLRSSLPQAADPVYSTTQRSEQHRRDFSSSKDLPPLVSTICPLLYSASSRARAS